MRQAYDYWQDQPGNYFPIGCLVVVKTPPPLLWEGSAHFPRPGVRIRTELATDPTSEQAGRSTFVRRSVLDLQTPIRQLNRLVPRISHVSDKGSLRRLKKQNGNHHPRRELPAVGSQASHLLEGRGPQRPSRRIPKWLAATGLAIGEQPTSFVHCERHDQFRALGFEWGIRRQRLTNPTCPAQGVHPKSVYPGGRVHL